MFSKNVNIITKYIRLFMLELTVLVQAWCGVLVAFKLVLLKLKLKLYTTDGFKHIVYYIFELKNVPLKQKKNRKYQHKNLADTDYDKRY